MDGHRGDIPNNAVLVHKHHATLNNPKVVYGDGLLCFLFVFEKLAFRGAIHRTYHYPYHLHLVYCCLQK